jgi:hypothetical protein
MNSMEWKQKPCLRTTLALEDWKPRPSAASPAGVINTAAGQGVAIGRYRITRDQAKEIRRVEKKYGQGSPEALRALLLMLRS